MDKARVACLLSLMLSMTVVGCESTSPRFSAQAANVTTRAGEVSGCRAGNLAGLPSMPPTRELIQDLQNQAVGAGGNVVYRTSDKPPYHAATYHCDPGFMPK
jgi:hypothetical protein